MEDSIERSVEIAGPVSRVWSALTEPEQFGKWFGLALDGPFIEGETVIGRSGSGDCEGMVLELVVEAVEPESRLVWLWHPAAMEPDTDYSAEPMTRVEFVLAPTPGGTRVTVTESGFANIPEGRRPDAFRLNSRGWDAQIRNIKAYVEG